MDYKLRRKIEYCFYNYKTIKNRNEREQLDIIKGNMAHDQEKILEKGGKKGSVTENKAQQIFDRGLDVSWVKVIENTYRHFQFEFQGRLMRALYGRCMSNKEVIGKYGLHESTYYFWKNQWLAIAEQWAKHYGLVLCEKKKQTPINSVVFDTIDNVL